MAKVNFSSSLITSPNDTLFIKIQRSRLPRSLRHHNRSALCNNSDLPYLSYRSVSSTNRDVQKNLETINKKIKNPVERKTISLSRANRLGRPEKNSNTKIDIFPIPSSLVVANFSHCLTEFEKEEIKFYNKIYFTGNTLQNKISNPREIDDKDLNYQAKLGDHLIYRYEIFLLLGKGSFGVTYKCFDHKSKQFYAVKILKSNTTLENEIKILNLIKKNNTQGVGIVSIIDHFRFRNHCCIVFELLDLSLYQHLSLNNRRFFPVEVVKSYTKCLLKSLDFLKNLKIIHCDIKPSNIAFSNNPEVPLKLIDFGTSCFVKDSQVAYIQSRYYRAPEVLLGLPFDTSIDMWSLGCVVFEMLTGRILFPAKSEQEMLKMISFYKGRPPAEILNRSTKASLFFLDKQLAFDVADRNLADFLDKCLTWDPKLRLTPSEGLSHIWLK